MTFSRFFHHLQLFFLLCFVAIQARSADFAKINYCKSLPLFTEINDLPSRSFSSYNSIIADRENRLISSTNDEIIIFEGKNYWGFKTPEKPYIAYDGNNQIAVASGRELFILPINAKDSSALTRLISNNDNRMNIKFLGVGFGEGSIYLTSGKKLWRFKESLTLVDSSKYNISIYSSPKGILFYSTEKGFYFENGEEYKMANNVIHSLQENETVINISFSGSYAFVSTSTMRFLVINKQGEIICNSDNSHMSIPEIPNAVCTYDDINFFATTSKKIYQFLNPKLLSVIDNNQIFKGSVHSFIIFNGEQFVATSFALYKSRENSFTVIGYGNYAKLLVFKKRLYAIKSDGLQVINEKILTNVTHENANFFGVKIQHINQQAIYLIGNDTLNSYRGKTGSKYFKLEIGNTFSAQKIFLIQSKANPTLIQIAIEKGIPNLADIIFSIDKSINVNHVFLSSDSTLWISSSVGIIKISRDYLNFLKTYKPVLSISSIKVNDEDKVPTIGRKVDLKIQQGQKLTFKFCQPTQDIWLSSSFAYKINENNSEWIEWRSEPIFTFEKLKPGRHQLAFKTVSSIGIESTDLLINVQVIPYFFQTKFSIAALLVLILIITYVISRWRVFYFARERFKLEGIINRRTEELIKEKEKTDNLLERVLPRETASELKETGKVNTQKFNMVTVLFSDIQGFTRITDELNPENLIDQLDRFFLYFDSVVDKYRIEKIKTIGDAYMCAGGIPHKNRTNPVEVILAALEMLHYMREINQEHSSGQNIWDLRIGIDTGPIIAGVVGRNKLSYDIWGTTVNTASRMESSGEVGRINISGNTHILVQDYFICTYRGKMPIKNKGDIEMYFIDGIKPSLSHNYNIYKPNSEFLLQLQFLRFGDLEEFILEKLEKGLPKNLYYHNLKHTVDVYTQVELIGRSENVSQEEQLLLQTAALFHDAGHLIDYNTHEEMGVKLAREILPQYQYSERQIQIISELIMVTKLPPKPKNLLEAIMCDADLDYLGRTDFIPVSNNLYRELHEHGRIGTIQEWNEMQIKFIEKHQYFTNTARKLRNVNKNSQLENIKNWIKKNKL